LVVQSNALAKITGTTGNQITDGKYVPVVLNSGGVFDMNGQNETVDLVTMNSGVLRNSLATSVSTLTILQTAPVGATPHATNALTLGAGDNQFDVPSADAALNIAAIVNGSGNLVKTGLGTVSLLNSNNYTGNITLNDGVLSLSFADITNTATVTIATNSVLGTNAVLNLNFVNGETNTVSALVVAGVSKAPGLYSATTDPLYISGTGSLLVVPVAPPINPFPGLVQISNVGAGNLQLSWSTNAGWILQSNSVGLTAAGSWFSIPNSTNLTNLSITIDPGATNVFFRLLHP
jgi:autotransporter-associated beta strand protein